MDLSLVKRPSVSWRELHISSWSDPASAVISKLLQPSYLIPGPIIFPVQMENKEDRKGVKWQAVGAQQSPWFEFYPFLILLSESHSVRGTFMHTRHDKVTGAQLFLFSLNEHSKLPGPTGSWGIRRLDGLSFASWIEGFKFYPAL